MLSVGLPCAGPDGASPGHNTFDGGKAMIRGTLVMAGIVLGASGLIAARHDVKHEAKHEAVRTLAVRDITEKLDGKKAKATMVEVTLRPGESSAPHRHPGPVFGYVLEGEYEWAIDDNPARTLQVGDTFYEPTRCLHRVSRNPSKKGKTRILAVVLHPADVKDIVIPEKDQKSD
jgi:quercetin dioxygenase-like cupin family protein